MLNCRTMMSAERVYSEIQKLSEEERLRLDLMLEAGNDNPDPAVEEAWMKETLRRRAEWKAGKASTANLKPKTTS